MKCFPESVGVFGPVLSLTASLICFVTLFEASLIGVLFLLVAISCFNLLAAILFFTSESLCSSSPRINDYNKVTVATVLFSSVCWPIGILIGLFALLKVAAGPLMLVVNKFADTKSDTE